ncbi:MAG: hypothetical protein HZB51_00485 [Chloroflexi bacterium]|nr:hypothetical protein [Chloroflexota bacterium]
MSSHIVSYETLLAYAANELDERQSALVAEHIVACSECATTVTLFQNIRALLREEDTMEEPPASTVARAKAIFPPHIISYEQLIAYAAEDLDEIEAARVAEHLPNCEKCAMTITRFRLIYYLMSMHKAEAPPAAPLVATQNRFTDFTKRRPHKQGWGRIFEMIPVPGRLSAIVVAILVLVLTFVFAGSHTVANTAQDAIPGDTLYPVKTTMENTQINLAPDGTAKTELYLTLAQERLEEISALVAQGKYEDIPKVTKTFETQIQKVTVNLTTAIADDSSPDKVELARKVDTALSQYSSSLARLSENGPAQLKPDLERAVAASTEQRNFVRGIILSNPILLTATPETPVHTSVPALSHATLTPVPLPTETIFLPISTSVPVISTLVLVPPLTSVLMVPTPRFLPPSTNEPMIPTETPPVLITNTPSLPTATLLPSTSTPIISTATPLSSPPTSTPSLPTATPLPPPTNTPSLPTATPLPLPTNTPSLPTTTPLPPLPTSTSVVPTATSLPPATSTPGILISPTETPIPTSVPSVPVQMPTALPLTPTLPVSPSPSAPNVATPTISKP